MNEENFFNKYMASFQGAFNGILVSNQENPITYSQGLELSGKWLQEMKNANRKIMIIGNGGSAAIGNHMAVDFWKLSGIRAINFNDSSLLTAVSNDIAFDEVFATPIERFADEGDMLICISSSGNSENIVRGAKMAKSKGCKVITCSGFEEENRLRKMGDLNFYVPTYSYGFAETIHQLIVHSLMDSHLYCDDNVDIFYRNQEKKISNPS